MAAKKPGTKMTVWEERMAAAAQKQKTAEKPMAGFQQISTAGGIWAIDGTVLKPTELDVIILMAAHENAFYPGKYDPNNKVPPQCFSFGDLEADEPEEGMVPHEGSAEKQHENCVDCEHNVMGSSDTGSGKACKNIRRLAVVMAEAGDSADAMKEAEVRLLKLPVTSVRNWSKYVRGVLTDDMNKPMWAVKTRLDLVRDPKVQYRVQFEFLEAIDFDDKLFAELEKKQTAIAKTICSPYIYPDEDAAPAGNTKAGAKAMKPQGRVAEKAVAKRH